MALRTLLIAVFLLFIGASGLYLMSARAEELGLLAPAWRALPGAGILFSLAGAAVLLLKSRPIRVAVIGFTGLLIFGQAGYFSVYLPANSYPARESLTAFEFRQLDDQLITDSSSNGIIEVGFSYPIFTPAVEVRNNGIFTAEVNLFFRLTDAQGEEALFRAVRESIEGSALSVESSVQGLLSRNDDYLFIPLRIAPGRTARGRVAFVISNLEEGTSFSDALSGAQAAALELREPESGDLLTRLIIK